jgi:phospholipid/cholesterol/gamma-HCH transport system substrate-binding protein
MKRNSIEIGVGVFVILAIFSFVMIAIKASGLSGSFAQKNYTVTASFENIGGLKVRAPVTIAGVKIGEVKKITLNQTSFSAVVTLDIFEKTNQIPEDSSANIYTAGLIGANYVSLSPGYTDTFLKDGSVIETTHPALVLENLISQLLFNVKK